MLNPTRTLLTALFTVTTIFGSASCTTEKAPLAEGLMLKYYFNAKSKPEKSGDITLEFNKVRKDQWVVTKTKTALGGGEPKTDEVDEQLNKVLGGKPYGFLSCPLFLPKAERKPRGSMGELRVKKQEAFKGWPDAWRANLGPVVAHYDAKSGYFLGLTFNTIGNLEISLVDSNLEGLMPISAP